MTREEQKALWQRRLAEQTASGLSAWAWCAREGLSYAGLLRWRKRLGERGRQAPLTLVRLDEGTQSGRGLTLQVGAVRIDVGRDFDAVLLRRVVDVLAVA